MCAARWEQSGLAAVPYAPGVDAGSARGEARPSHPEFPGCRAVVVGPAQVPRPAGGEPEMPNGPVPVTMEDEHAPDGCTVLARPSVGVPAGIARCAAAPPLRPSPGGGVAAVHLQAAGAKREVAQTRHRSVDACRSAVRIARVYQGYGTNNQEYPKDR
jgi:hypothetical protein